jgi:hypothetical protein
VPGCRFPGQKAAERRARQAEGIAAARHRQTEGRMLPGNAFALHCGSVPSCSRIVQIDRV